MLVLFTGGGTAGHVLPNVPLIEALAARGHELHYAGSGAAMERQLLASLPVSYHVLSTGKLRRYLSVENLRDIWRVGVGVLQGIALVRRLRPAVVFSKGGFVSVPAVLGAALCGVPIIAHESDLSPGLANRIANRVARIVCTTFPETNFGGGSGGPPDPRIRFTGLPLRRALAQGEGARGRAFLGLAPDDAAQVLLIMGGSQGSVRLNNFVRDELRALTTQFFVVHLCGRGNCDEALQDQPRYRQYEFLAAELGDVLAAADLVISRAGATALYELLALRKSVLLIPLTRAQSRGDQIENAQWALQHGFCRMLEEGSLTLSAVLTELTALAAERMERQARLAASFAAGDATGQIVALIEGVASGQ